MTITATYLPPDPGTYVLVASLQHKKEIQVGKLARIDFRPGVYAYVGSAFGSGGLSARLYRHLRPSKKRHWHIDYLLPYTRVEAIWMAEGPLRLEHRWAAALGGKPASGTPIGGFGCSDCRCVSHLFHFSRMPQKDLMARILNPQWCWTPSACGSGVPPRSVC